MQVGSKFKVNYETRPKHNIVYHAIYAKNKCNVQHWRNWAKNDHHSNRSQQENPIVSSFKTCQGNQTPLGVDEGFQGRR